MSSSYRGFPGLGCAGRAGDAVPSELRGGRVPAAAGRGARGGGGGGGGREPGAGLAHQALRPQPRPRHPDQGAGKHAGGHKHPFPVSSYLVALKYIFFHMVFTFLSIILLVQLHYILKSICLSNCKIVMLTVKDFEDREIETPFLPRTCHFWFSSHASFLEAVLRHPGAFPLPSPQYPLWLPFRCSC